MVTAVGNAAIPSKGGRDTELKQAGSPSTKELLRSQTIFPRLFGFKAFQKETFCNQEQKLYNHFTASDQPTRTH